MSKTLRLGLGNVVSSKTMVFHGGVTTRDSFGRMTDLLVVWTKKEHNLSKKLSGDLRVLVQGLLEFGFPENKSSVGHLEVAIENQQIYIGLRFENFILLENDDVEKKLAQFWLNSEDASLLKRILYPQDRVEVRFLVQLNLLEWRIIRNIGSTIVLDTTSFQVFSDVENSLMSEHDQFVDMGDVHYGDWVSEVYQNSHDKNKSGDLFEDGESVQGESEWARVVSERDQKSIDEAAVSISQKNDANENASVVESVDKTFEEIEDLSGKSMFISEIDMLKEKIKQFEVLLKKKEKQIQKSGMDIVNLRKKIDDVIKVSRGTDAKQIQLFRDKAMQMFEMVKALQSEKQVLEKTIFDMKREYENPTNGVKAQNESPGLLLQIDELNKKADRFARALESEKQKVKTFLDRALVAEREAQSSAPIISDLERKLETASRMSQQSKKETEVVKQKLIQSDAEKNKINNDLIKAQAQIQTLLKRQAA
jgi:hypothetical protein